MGRSLRLLNGQADFLILFLLQLPLIAAEVGADQEEEVAGRGAKGLTAEGAEDAATRGVLPDRILVHLVEVSQLFWGLILLVNSGIISFSVFCTSVLVEFYGGRRPW